MSLPEYVTVPVAVTSSVVGVIVTVAKFKDSRPVRWLLERLVHQPLGEVLDRRIEVAMEPLIDKVNSIHYEIHPNTGHSMRDVLDRVEGTTIYTQGQVEKLQEDVIDLRDRTSRVEGVVEVLRDRL